MTTPPNGGNGNAVTLREVYALLKEVRSDLTLEITKVAQHVDAQFSHHTTEHAEHEAQHVRDATHREKDEAKRASMIRWAVTTIIAAIGIIAAIVIPLVQR